MNRVRLDLNHDEFQADLLALEREDLLSVASTLRKLRQMDWNSVYRDTGLKWEAIQRKGPRGERLYSLRVSRSTRAIAYRDGDLIVFLAVHSDHDSAYKK